MSQSLFHQFTADMHCWSFLIISGAITVKGYFSNYVWPFHLIDLNCTGEENNVFDCVHNQLEDYTCSGSHDASVVCQGTEKKHVQAIENNINCMTHNRQILSKNYILY